MKVENIEGWPEDACFVLQRAKFELITNEESTDENMRKWMKMGHNKTTNVALFANPNTVKMLDTQIPTTETTYRQYLVMRGIVNHIIEDYDWLTEDGNVYLFRV